MQDTRCSKTTAASLLCFLLALVLTFAATSPKGKQQHISGGFLANPNSNPVNDACAKGILSVAQSLKSTSQDLCFASAVVVFSLLSGKWDPYIFRNGMLCQRPLAFLISLSRISVSWITAEQLGDIVIQPRGLPGALFVSFGHIEDGADGIIHSFVFERNRIDPKSNEMQYRIWMSRLSCVYSSLLCALT